MMMVIEDGMHMGAVKCVKSFDWFGGLQINARTARHAHCTRDQRFTEISPSHFVW